MKICATLIVFVWFAGVLIAGDPGSIRPIITGGWHDRDVNDPFVQEMAAFAAQKMGLELQEVLSAESQVVAGFNYRMELLLNDGTNAQRCTVNAFQGLMNEGKSLKGYGCVLV